MNVRSPFGCEQFDVHADELALGQLDEPLRGQLLQHAAGCPHCHSLLDSLCTVADRLLLTAPQMEPPAGFESRALARLGPEVVGRARRPRGRRWVLTAAAAGIVLAGGFVAVRRDVDPKRPTATIVASAGAEVGSVQLIADPTPHVLIVIDAPRPGPGVRACELRRADGTWETVGWWDAADIAAGVWAVGIDPALLDATAMRITSDGDVLAAATFG